jgi:hypothetical protein
VGVPQLIMRRLPWVIQTGQLTLAWLRANGAARTAQLQPVLSALDTASEYARDNSLLLAEWTWRAEQTAGGEFHLLSAGKALAPVFRNWRKHPLSGASIPRTQPFEFETFGPGDLWLAFWLNTLPHAPLLAHGAVFGSSSSRDCLIEMIDSWVRDQRPIPSPYWQSGFDIALRGIGILYAWSLIGQGVPEKTRVQIASIALLSGALLERAVQRQSYNHQIVEAYGLFCVGLALRASLEGQRWMERGAAILEAELRRQFFEDGMHAERCPGYMLLICEIYIHFHILGTRAGHRFSPDSTARLLRMFEAAAELCEGNVLPAFNDNSETSLFSGGKDMSAAFSLAAAAFSRPDFKVRAGGFPVPAFWIAGDQGYRAFRDVVAPSPRERVSSALTQSGFYVMRDADRLLRLTCGHEISPKNGHSHADLLSFELQVGRDAVLTDPGTCSYHPLDSWRRYFRSTRAHNTVTVDGQDQALPIPGDSFGWSDYPPFQIRKWQVSKELDVFEGEHFGYARLKPPVVHRRKIIFLKPSCWIILDDVNGVGVHDCDLHFQFSSGEVRLQGACAVTRREWGRLEIWQLTENCDVSLESGSVNPIRGWASSGYGQRIPAPSLRFRHSGSVPVRFCTVILAADHEQRTLVCSTQNSAEQIVEIQLGGLTEWVCVGAAGEPVVTKHELATNGQHHGH